ncbi:MAG TPA: hypothetical protein VGQ36_09445 [Thermoanaerobaculia bacterium]|jgi:hypothetical protein|nr:hypothetical protein [Thermoanaerobaculia bacterium]
MNNENAPSVVALDDRDTWPRDVCELLEREFELLRSYEIERLIDNRGKTDIVARVRPPTNPHRAEQQRVLRDLNRLAGNVRLIGYHCTRLADDEIENIWNVGLRPLSLDLIHERVERRLAAACFSEAVAQRLLRTNEADEEGRRHRIAFIFTRNPLRDEDGVGRLLAYWGGEALYRCHEDDDEIAPILQAIGTPCIVEVALPVRSVHLAPIGELIMRLYLHHRGVPIDHDPDVEGSVTTPVGAGAIRRLLQRSDPDFGRLTHCQEWTVYRL